jgi:hypothetical protein
MKSYQLYKGFLDENICNYLLKTSIETFEIDKRTKGGWHARSNRSDAFEQEVKDIFNSILSVDEYDITWINLSEYENNRRLKPHKDGDSQMTVVCNLTDGYEGGEFILGDSELDLELGDVVVFNGGDIFHGVKPVRSGYRASFNIWFTKKIKSFL